MDEEKQSELASKGGKAVYKKGTAHEFSSEEASEAGKKGGQARHSEEGVEGTPLSGVYPIQITTTV